MRPHRGVLIAGVLASIVFQTPASIAEAQSADASTCLASLLGAWRGPGTILGRPIVMEQRWERAVGRAFIELRMRHLATDSSTVASFEGRGFYRNVGTRAPDSLTGTWLDARGLRMDVAGSCSATTMSSHWSGAERGRTIYARHGDELEVIDSVFPANGAAREFGRSRLRRVASDSLPPR